MADAGSQPNLGTQVLSNHANASKFYYHFLYKAVIVTIFLVILPLFSSQTPEFINQNLHNTSWEIFQLIFVGIAVSYGLFSKRSQETEKDYHTSKFDNAQSYVSKLLQVSSVFDDETENTCDFDDNKIQTWNSQYYRGEPVVVVAKKSHVHENRATTSHIGDKPLLLPVRSLKSRVHETEKESGSIAGSLSRSSSSSGSNHFSSHDYLNLEEMEGKVIHRSGSKRLSGNTNRPRNEVIGGFSPLNLPEKFEEGVVHHSPIPWKSRSGMFEMKEDVDVRYLFTSMENSESRRIKSRSFRSLSSNSSTIDSNSPSPNKLSPSPSLSSSKDLSPLPCRSLESQATSVEDFARNKSFHRSSSPPIPPPPPPPPPPPAFLPKSRLMKSNCSLTNDDEVTLRRSIRSVPMEELSDNRRVEPPRRADSGSQLIRQRFSTMSKTMVMEFPEEEKQEYIEKVLVETDDDDDDDDDDDTETDIENDYFEEVTDKKETAIDPISDGGPDVDKKADEFIAKFREQIRLQRIESIRRLSRQQHVRNHSR